MTESDTLKGIVKSDEHRRFHIKDLDQLRGEIAALGLDIPMEAHLGVLGTELRIGSRVADNRFAVHPMEGFDAGPDGSPGELSFRRYARYARGGFALIWFEATAVMREARSNPRQLYIHQGNGDAFRRLVEATRREARDAFGREPVLVLQLTHSGRYSKPDGVPVPLIAHRSAVLDPLHELPDDYPVVTDEYLDRLQDTYVDAARIAAEAGFDGVDVKACHRYLVSELLASFTREGRYGGGFENRTRFLRETLGRIHHEVPGIFVTTRMNAYDAIPYPFGFGVDREDFCVPDLSEPIKLVRQLREANIPILNVSIGNPYYNPHYGRPYDFPIHGVKPPAEHPLAGLGRFIGITRDIQQAHPDLPVVGSGYSWLRQFIPVVAAGALKQGWAGFIGIGRGAFAYPNCVKDILDSGTMDPAKCCVTCSACTQIMRDGGMTGCVVRDSEIYGPEYRRARRLSLDRLREEAKRCRDCEVPTCGTGCPAHIDIPTFVKAFADGDIATAYAVLRRSNVLPEMCGYVCPSEVQCEGACLEDIFCEHPIPIQDIQLVTCRSARRMGLVGVHVPETATGRRIAVAGGGPAGVACAIRLLEHGHHVTVFEKESALGGAPDAVIPSERYGVSQAEIDAVLAPALAAGRIEYRFGATFGKDLPLDALQEDFDAVLISIGLGQSVSLGEGEGVIDALTFLKEAKLGRWTEIPDKVAVLGGGNTAMDAAVTARGLGARDVYLVYRRSFAEMPAWPSERDRFLESGGHCLILTQPTGYELEAGKLTGIRIVRTELGEPDASGRRRPEPVAGSESVLEVDLAIEALGQQLNSDVRKALEPLAFSPRGLVQTRDPQSTATRLDGVFVAGDLLNGGTTAVQAVTEGMRAAEEIDGYLEQSVQ